MTKKPPKKLWVNVYKSIECDGGLYFGTHKTSKDAKLMRLPVDNSYVGTFKYVLDKGKK